MILLYVLMLCSSGSVRCDGLFEAFDLGGKDTGFLGDILRTKYRDVACSVHVRVRNGNSSRATPAQRDLIEDAVRSNSDWMTVSYGDLPPTERRPAFYNVFLVRDFESVISLLDGMTYETHEFHGLYTIVVEQLEAERIQEVLERAWNLTILNVAVVVEESNGTYVAYSYHPYRELRCGVVEPIPIGWYENGTWLGLDEFFPDILSDLHGCPLTVGAIEIRPFSMVRRDGTRTEHYGLEVDIAETIAARMNFTMHYVHPTGNIKWGILHEANSTGLVGMLQRSEANFGFGSLGLSLSRYTYLKVSTPSHLTQMSIGIPPKRPYTSLEKLFQPFTVEAWVCIACGYGSFAVVTVALVKLNRRMALERIRHPVYSLWVMLMGGSVGRLRLNSTRMFLIGFVMNALIIRTLYQAGMFQRLQASESLAADLDTFSAINSAGLNYNMFRSTVQFYKGNPMVPGSRIKVVQNDLIEWDLLFYGLSQDRLGGVLSAPIDCFAYYVKRFGSRGVVYLSKTTGFTYTIGMHYPKTTSLQGPFDGWILRLHASGLVQYWAEAFRDNRYWTHAKEDPAPSSLRWNQISGGFFLCGVLLLLATVVFAVEIVHFRLCASRRPGRFWGKPRMVKYCSKLRNIDE